jgi:hypothetical protein
LTTAPLSTADAGVGAAEWQWHPEVKRYEARFHTQAGDQQGKDQIA